MSATTASRPTGASRRSPPVVSGSGSPAASSIPRGATARAAVSPRLSSSLSGGPIARRHSIKGTVSPPPVVPDGSREALAASLKQETEEKEKLLLQLQDKDQTIASLRSENGSLTSALHAAETRLNELYNDQHRAEEEMAARVEVTDKLRSQLRELEKEKRDAQRRYNEQTTTFEAERQAFYDNEQHLKSRIQSLSQARKQHVLQPIPASPSVVSVVESEVELEEEQQPPAKQDMSDPEQEPAEMTALRLELSTLLTSHASLQSTLVLLQSQLNDLKRVNHQLQEDNESYNILLQEKTLSGQFNILRMGGAADTEPNDSVSGDDEALDSAHDVDSLLSRGTGRSVLDPVDELAEEHEEEHLEESVLDPLFEQTDDQEPDENQPLGRSRSTRHTRKRSSVAVPRGESLANLPITGPGLDLAAELGRAENKDMLEGRASLDDRTNTDGKPRKGKKDIGRKVSAMSDQGIEPSISTLNDIESLRSEVKSLKDANKALSLYASKIIDRIISQEGFEHVLAADWEKTPSTPATATSAASPPIPESASSKKSRPQTMMFSRSTPPTTANTPNIPPVEKLTTFDSLSSPSSSPDPSQPAQTQASPSAHASRRSLSFDWRSFSVFGSTEKKAEPANLRPLTLKAGAPVVTGARKLDTHEDEEDRRERERLNATMKLMGIEKPEPTPASPLPLMLKSYSTPAPATVLTDSPPLSANTITPTATAPSNRFSFFRRTPSVKSEPPSFERRDSPSPVVTPNLTHEALEQADAEASIAALDAHERTLSAEIAKGASGGYTDIVRRSGDRRSSRRSGSGSTVWSAGMSSKHEDD